MRKLGILGKNSLFLLSLLQGIFLFLKLCIENELDGSTRIT